MKERLLKLLELKSIITIVLVLAGVFGFINGSVAADVFTGWVAMILVYYFQKDNKKE